jgi:hypothetical protein
MAERTTSVPTVRVVLATLLIAYIALGPSVVQVLDVDTDILLRWTMFNTRVNPMCLVEYRDVSPNGYATRVDRFEWLGITDPSFAPRDVAVIDSPEEAVAVGHKLCRERRGVDLRVFAKCPRNGTWEIALTGETNLCTATPRKS